MWIGCPCVSAWAIFFLPLFTSLQIVPLDMPIFWPACSWDSPSRSTSLMASSSAGSMVISFVVVVGCGMNFSVFIGVGIVTGFGNLPRLPRLCLRPNDIVGSSVFMCVQ